MVRRFLLVVLVFLVIVVVVADRVAVLVGGHVLATKVETDEGLTSRPSVSIGGFPFLTQAFAGSYKNVRIVAHNVRVRGVTVTTLTVHLHGVKVPLSQAVRGSVSRVPVSTADGAAFVSFPDLNAYLADHHPPGDHIVVTSGRNNQVTATVHVTSGVRHATLVGSGQLSVAGNVVQVSLGRLAPAASSHRPGFAIPPRLKPAGISFPMRQLPFQITLTSVTTSLTGITATGEAHNIVLGSHSPRRR